MDKVRKFLNRLNKKSRAEFFRIFKDIFSLSLEKYDIKPMKGFKGFYHLRKGNIRIVFIKEKSQGIIIDIAFRKDIYKNHL